MQCSECTFKYMQRDVYLCLQALPKLMKLYSTKPSKEFIYVESLKFIGGYSKIQLKIINEKNEKNKIRCRLLACFKEYQNKRTG